MFKPEELVAISIQNKEISFERNEVAPVKCAIESAARMGQSSVVVYDPHIKVLQILEKQGFSVTKKTQDSLCVTISWGRTLGSFIK